MKFIIAISIVFYSSQSMAVFQKVWKGYQVSKIYQIQQIDKEIVKEDFKFQDDIFDWKFNLNPVHSEANPASIYSFQSQKTINDSLTFGLSKTSYKFGTFSINQQKTTYDISKWSSSSLANFPDTTLYENKISVNYSYEFLDRSSDIDYELLETNYKSETLRQKLVMEDGFLSFFTTYIQAKYQVYAVELSKSFVVKAKKRVNLIKRRVKDGLSLNVELLQAQSSLLNQQETLEKNKSELKTNLAILENILGSKIQESYFSKLNWYHKKFNFWNEFIPKNQHLSIDVLKEKIKTSEKQLEKIKDQNGYKLTLETSYAANALAASDSKSIDETFKRNSTVQSVSLNLVIPLGLDKRDSLRQKYSYQKMRNKLELLNTQEEVTIKKETLIERINFLERSYEIADGKVSLSEETLNQQNKLYLRGQATFEEVIRAEENYINTRLNEKRTLLEYETLIANYAYLNNGLFYLLNKYQD